MTTRHDDQVRQKIKERLARLCLAQMTQRLDEVLDDSSRQNHTVAETLLRLLDAEIVYREERVVQRRIRQAHLPRMSTIDAFDFNYSKSRLKHKAMIMSLLELDFIRQHKDVIFLGGPGVGKTFLTECIALAACRAKMRVCFTTVMDMVNTLTAAKKVHLLGKKLLTYRKPALLCCDELGYLSLDKQGADLIFQVLSHRSGRASTIITTNLPFRDWGDIFGSVTLAAAVADRLAGNSELIILERSFRTGNKQAEP
jgi:DNA replication protein DnaC